MKRTGMAAVLAGSAALSGVLLSGEAEARCFMAFIHGWGANQIKPSANPFFGDPDPIFGNDAAGIQEKRIRLFWAPHAVGAPHVGLDPSTSFVWGATNTWPKNVGFAPFDYPLNKNRSGAPPCEKADGTPTYFVVGYNGLTAFWNPNGETPPADPPNGWEQGASGIVARQLSEFIDAHGIQENELVLIGHSMGGLVARWILNNGVSESAYYSSLYEKVAKATRYAITNGTGHLGFPAADALSDLDSPECAPEEGKLEGCIPEAEPDSPFAACGPILVEFFTRADPGTFKGSGVRSLRTKVLKQASASGGWMQDGVRNKPIYTVAATDWLPSTTYAPTADMALTDLEGSIYWVCLNYVRTGARYGGATSNTAGDGMSTRRSAHGMYDDTDSTATCNAPTPPGNIKPVTCAVSWTERSFMASMAGMRRMWLDVSVNHQALRWNAHNRTIVDYFRRNGVGKAYWKGQDYIGDYTAKYGRDLDLYD